MPSIAATICWRDMPSVIWSSGVEVRRVGMRIAELIADGVWKAKSVHVRKIMSIRLVCMP